jgi:hypothetical protein
MRREVRGMRTILAASVAFMVSLPVLSQAKKPVPIGWQQEPKTFRGVAWGTSEKDAKVALKFESCSDVTAAPSSAKIRRCVFPFNLGSVSVSGYLQFMNDELVSAFGNFPSEKYDTVRTAVVQEYGPPRTVNTPTASIRSGPFEHLTWEGPKVAIVLDAEGYFHILTVAYRAIVLKPN